MNLTGTGGNTLAPAPAHQPLPPVCAVIVTYNPDASFQENVRALLPQVNRAIIVDNASSSPGREYVAQLASLPSVEVIWNSQNLGIAAALNAGSRHASAAGFHWIATFDQDSRVSPAFISSMWEAYAACPSRDRVAIIGPHYTWEETVLGPGPSSPAPASSLYKEVRSTMTSGNLVNADILFRCGLFDESYFIDYVDHEFCLRARKRGFLVIEALHAHLAHRLGNRMVLPAFGRSFTVSHHNALRRYYNTRNRLRTWRRFLLSEPAWVFSDAVGIIKETIKLALFEQDRKEKLKFMARGAADAIRDRSGPYSALQ